MAGGPFDNIPDIATLEKRFSFIESDITRQNITICFQYIIFLTVVSSLYTKGGSIALSVNRDIVVHTASVVESCLHYGITQLIAKEASYLEMIEKSWKRVGQGDIHTFTENEKIVWVKQTRSADIYGENPSSKQVNKAALGVGLIDETLFQKAEEIRTARNHIHFIEGSKMVSYPSKEKVDEFFSNAKEILDKVESALSV